MRVTNLTHGSFYLIGAYVALSAMRSFNSFAAAAVCAALVVIAIGLVVYSLLRATGSDPLRETLLTFGLVFIIADVALLIWGGDPTSVPKPRILQRPSGHRRPFISELPHLHHRAGRHRRCGDGIPSAAHACRSDGARCGRRCRNGGRRWPERPADWPSHVPRRRRTRRTEWCARGRHDRSLSRRGYRGAALRSCDCHHRRHGQSDRCADRCFGRWTARTRSVARSFPNLALP